MADSLGKSLLTLILPKKLPPEGTSVTTTYNETSPNVVLSAPSYREHQDDIFTSRYSLDSRALIQQMLKSDPDMSAALNAFLTVANTEPVFLVRSADGKSIDRAGQEILIQILVAMTVRSDYSQGFQMPKSLITLSESCRYMVLMRGGLAGELVLNREFFPSEVRLVDLATLQWVEPKPGAYYPQQKSVTGKFISLDIPTFFTAWFRRDPTGIYSHSPFLSAINTIAARQQVINDLYRIMKVTGYPRMEATVLEEVLVKNMPPEISQDPAKKRVYITNIIGSIASQLSSLRPDQAFVHTDSIKTGIINEKVAGVTLDIGPVIATLNAQNQAGLKTMATIIGRGESGVNTASVEARIFSLSAQALNEPLADLYSQLFTLALRMQGSQSYVECYFNPVEMRSDTELETQKLVKGQRLRQELSDGLISDEEYHLWMYNRLPPPGTPVLSGTGFNTEKATVDSTNISPNRSSIDSASVSPEGNKPARDNKSKVKNNAQKA